ncbi:MAG: alpha/beta hydrolase [Candidatus Abyssobacteria bacterium SURF_17]|jgi:pimeloyl-ACP methyl ester carboxylesterase|uniref:Alpha/beta hydrolase n=1 Tax=Candidatus Abyssobacteria bacterium SURF_17 TaxID=2093361 RepID=A0A419EYM3_9BACT|nr:MAG: alpha/beta hydrolase [Candidatus Abyssubacteria bacterium SURF_17]
MPRCVALALHVERGNGYFPNLKPVSLFGDCMNTPQPKTLTIDGARASYRVWGEGREPTVLCLHGNPTSSFLWRHLGAGLQDSMRVIAPDLPGHGGSELGSRAGTWEEMEDFVERFTQSLGIERFTLILHDWGGLIGFRWLFDHPQRVRNLRKLVVSDTGFFSVDNSAWHSLAKIWRTPGEGEAWMNALTFDAFRDGMRAWCRNISDDAVLEYWKSLATHERRMAKLALYRSGNLEKIKPYDGKLGTLACPTLILWSENDPFIPAAAGYRFHAEIPASRLHALSGVSHFLWEEAPEQTIQLVRSFFIET